MSAFLVEDKTINAIIAGITLHRSISHVKEKIESIGYELDTVEGRKKLGWDMFALNIRAVSQRYVDSPADQFRPLNYTFKPESYYSLVFICKALGCWLYQCAEGDCCEKELYKLMQDAKNKIANEIVRGLPEYEKSDAWR